MLFLLAAAALPLAWSLPAQLDRPSHARPRAHERPDRTLARRQSAANCNPSTQFFTQKLDHNSSNTATWQQQYQIVTDYYKPGGPIFLFQGEETVRMTCVESTVLESWAQATGGIAASIEHRYFGLSLPLGSNSLTTSGLKYLTLENVIGDAEEFVSQIKANVSGAANAKVAVASGSYGGFLMVAFRQNSDAFDGVVASASPVRSVGLDADDPDRFNWFDWTSDVYVNASISDRIKSGLQALNDTFNSDPSALVPALGLCSAPQEGITAAEYQTAFDALLDFYTEFNYAHADPGRTPIANSLDVIVQAIQAVPEDQPLQVLNESIWQWYGPLGGFPCFDPVFNLSSGVPLIQEYPFQWITCTYMPVSTEDVNSTNPTFLPGLVLEQQKAASCQQQYNVSHVPSAAELEAKYHFSEANLEASTGIIFSQGGWDPTSSISVPASFPVPANGSYASVRLYAPNMGHREDLFAPADGDRQDVIDIRAHELQILQSWFAQ